eukprot:207040_1
MVSKNWPTYVVLSLYVLATILVTIAANRKNRDPTDESTHITKHFLASKNFGLIILTFTTFASVFSGYTVVGVPNEAGVSGFRSVRWMSFIHMIALSMLWLYPRLRRLSIIRCYESPGGFIEDRFKSKSISIIVAILVCVPQLLYIGINLFSLGAVIDNLTEGELGFYPVVVASTILCLVFEAFGGMRSVAYTDAVEAIVMLAVFITVPIMITVFTGGFIGQINNSHDLTVPCLNSNEEQTSGCLNYDTNDISSEYLLRSPSSVTILNYVLFTLSALSFALNPHVTQRALTAQTDAHVRFVVIAIFIATFVTMTPGVLTGITHIANKPELKQEYQTFGAFQAMLAVFRDRGGFSTLVSYVALLAGIAGIMSTADSALIGVSNTVSCDIIKNWISSESTSAMRIVRIGKIVSVCTMSLCLVFAIYLWETKAEYGVVITIQQGLLWQAVPAYVFGLYSKLPTKPVLYGTIVGTLSDIVLIGIAFGGEGIDPFPLVDKSWTTCVGLTLNVTVSLIAHYFVFNKQSETEHKEQLTYDKMQVLMGGIEEPVTKYCGCYVWLSLVLVLVSAFHWIGEIDPELIDEYGLEETKGMMYNGYVRDVIWGLPDWVLATLVWYVVATVVGIYATTHWTVNVEKYQKTANASDANISMQSTNKINDIDRESDVDQAAGDEEENTFRINQ